MGDMPHPSPCRGPPSPPPPPPGCRGPPSPPPPAPPPGPGIPAHPIDFHPTSTPPPPPVRPLIFPSSQAHQAHHRIESSLKVPPALYPLNPPSPTLPSRFSLSLALSLSLRVSLSPRNFLGHLHLRCCSAVNFVQSISCARASGNDVPILQAARDSKGSKCSSGARGGPE
jgi:hypothetical protein